MKKKIAVFAVVAGMAGVVLADVPVAVSYAFEDAAFQAATRLNANSRVCSTITNVAFAKLWYEEGAKAQGASENEAIVFETALSAFPGNLHFVVHVGHDADWKLIDEIFDQASDFGSWDPKTCPKLKKLKLCDAILTAHLVGIYRDSAAHALSVRLALRLIHVATAEEIWSGVVEGAYSDAGPDNEKVSPQWRKALEACASNAVERLPAALDGYGLLLLPIEGNGGRAFGQAFLNALTAAGRQEKIRVYDLPNGNAADRMLARFLRERAGSETTLGESVMRRIEAKDGGSVKSGKLALMTGNVAQSEAGSSDGLGANGLPVDFLGNSQPRGRYEIAVDLKFRDVNDNFRLIGSIGASGVYESPKDPDSPIDRILGYGMMAVVAVGCICILALFAVIWKIFKSITRAR